MLNRVIGVILVGAGVMMLVDDSSSLYGTAAFIIGLLPLIYGDDWSWFDSDDGDGDGDGGDGGGGD